MDKFVYFYSVLLDNNNSIIFKTSLIKKYFQLMNLLS